MDSSTFSTQWRETTLFEVEITEVKSACRANHKKGEKFEFDWNTPEGMCGEAFSGMYPLLFSLRVGGDMKLLGSDERNTKVYTCPSRVVTFKITAVELCSLCGKREGLEDCEILIEGKPMSLRVCRECRVTHGRK